MAVKRVGSFGEIGRVGHGAEDRLRSDLEREWRRGDPSAGEPLIYEVREPRSGALHIYVVWDALEPLSHERRSILITDVLAAVAPSDVPNLTLAMGLTGREAEEMGIETHI